MTDAHKALLREVLAYVLDAEHAHFDEHVAEGNAPEDHVFHKASTLMRALTED